MMDERLYSEEEICAMLERAQALGLDVDHELALSMTVADLERLVRLKQ